jgi:hypothetical protein
MITAEFISVGWNEVAFKAMFPSFKDGVVKRRMHECKT